MTTQVCTRCVMDNVSDETITFETDGTCNYCNYALSRKNTVYFPNAEGEKKLNALLQTIKEEGKGKKYDCLMGISGGLDSTYLAYLGAKYWNLKILAVHIDDGFDTKAAKENIKKLCSKLKIELNTIKPDKQQYFDIIKSFLRAGVPAIAIPQDNILQAYLFQFAREHKIKYFLSGANFSLESILERGNSYIAADGTHIKAIHKIYGEVPITNLPIMTLTNRFIGQKYIYHINTVRPLDLINYKKDEAIRELQENIDFDYYGGKHYESLFTKFVQTYYLPRRFNVDKRKSHLSSLIVSNQLSREEAVEELNKPLYDNEKMDKDVTFILNEIGMSLEEFDKLMNEPGSSHERYRVSSLVKFKNVARKYRKILSE